jgi:hypothetical protein
MAPNRVPTILSLSTQQKWSIWLSAGRISTKFDPDVCASRATQKGGEKAIEHFRTGLDRSIHLQPRFSPKKQNTPAFQFTAIREML